jgi:hypothetical protein
MEFGVMTVSDQTWRKTWFTTAIVGTSLGLAVGAVIGVLAGRLSPPEQASFFQIPIHASASHGQDNYILATGRLEEDVEYVAFLDALTGDLKAAALNMRTNKFQAYFGRNIADDFGSPKPKNPQFLMVTGEAAFQRAAGIRFAQSAIYVMELTTGRCAAYAIPSISGRTSLVTQTFAMPLHPLDRVEFRQVKLRPTGAEG